MSRITLLVALAVIVVVSFAPGCASSVGPTGRDGGCVGCQTDGSTANACTLPSGGVCARGSTCPAGDGCNQCSCSPSGALTCTRMACGADAGMPGQQCRTSADCPGQTCAFTTPGCGVLGRCTDFNDGCEVITYCGCDGASHAARCSPTSPYQNLGECSDTTEPYCRSNADCPAQHDCVFQDGSCEVHLGLCMPAVDCDEPLTYCGCDGTTFSDCRATRPYVHAGLCGELPDAGTMACPAAPPANGTVCTGATGVCGYGICFGMPGARSLRCECELGAWRCDEVFCD